MKRMRQKPRPWDWSMAAILILLGVMGKIVTNLGLAQLQELTAGALNIGITLLVLQLFALVAYNNLSPEERRQADLERQDERNKLIQEKTEALAGNLTVSCTGIGSLVAMWTGQELVAYVCTGLMVLYVIFFFCAPGLVPAQAVRAPYPVSVRRKKGGNVT